MGGEKSWGEVPADRVFARSSVAFIMKRKERDCQRCVQQWLEASLLKRRREDHLSRYLASVYNNDNGRSCISFYFFSLFDFKTHTYTRVVVVEVRLGDHMVVSNHSQP